MFVVNARHLQSILQLFGDKLQIKGWLKSILYHSLSNFEIVYFVNICLDVLK